MKVKPFKQHILEASVSSQALPTALENIRKVCQNQLNVLMGGDVDVIRQYGYEFIKVGDTPLTGMKFLVLKSGQPVSAFRLNWSGTAGDSSSIDSIDVWVTQWERTLITGESGDSITDQPELNIRIPGVSFAAILGNAGNKDSGIAPKLGLVQLLANKAKVKEIETEWEGQVYEKVINQLYFQDSTLIEGYNKLFEGVDWVQRLIDAASHFPKGKPFTKGSLAGSGIFSADKTMYFLNKLQKAGYVKNEGSKWTFVKPLPEKGDLAALVGLPAGIGSSGDEAAGDAGGAVVSVTKAPKYTEDDLRYIVDVQEIFKQDPAVRLEEFKSTVEALFVPGGAYDMLFCFGPGGIGKCLFGSTKVKVECEMPITKTIKIQDLFKAVEKKEGIAFVPEKMYDVSKYKIKIPDAKGEMVEVTDLIKKEGILVTVMLDSGEKIQGAETHIIIPIPGKEVYLRDIKVGDKIQKVSGESFNVTKVKRGKKKELFYDMTVKAKDHLYSDAAGFVHHNTFNTKEIVEANGYRKGIDYGISQGSVEIPALTEFLWKWRKPGQVAIFDDCDNALAPETQNFWKNAFQDEMDARNITYGTNDRYDADAFVQAVKDNMEQACVDLKGDEEGIEAFNAVKAHPLWRRFFELVNGAYETKDALAKEQAGEVASVDYKKYAGKAELQKAVVKYIYPIFKEILEADPSQGFEDEEGKSAKSKAAKFFTTGFTAWFAANGPSGIPATFPIRSKAIVLTNKPATEMSDPVKQRAYIAKLYFSVGDIFSLVRSVFTEDGKERKKYLELIDHEFAQEAASKNVRENPVRLKMIEDLRKKLPAFLSSKEWNDTFKEVLTFAESKFNEEEIKKMPASQVDYRELQIRTTFSIRVCVKTFKLAVTEKLNPKMKQGIWKTDLMNKLR